MKNEELKNTLTQFLTRALDMVNSGLDVAQEQLPLLLQEIVTGRLYDSILGTTKTRAHGLESTRQRRVALVRRMTTLRSIGTF